MLDLQIDFSRLVRRTSFQNPPTRSLQKCTLETAESDNLGSGYKEARSVPTWCILSYLASFIGVVVPGPGPADLAAPPLGQRGADAAPGVRVADVPGLSTGGALCKKKVPEEIYIQERSASDGPKKTRNKEAVANCIHKV